MSGYELDNKKVHSSCSVSDAQPRAAGPERADRLQVVKTAHSFGSVRMGDRAETAFEPPANRGLEDAMLNIVVEGEAFSLKSMWAQRLRPASRKGCSQPDPTSVVYKPPTKGAHSGRLIFTARWPDGHVERAAIELTGRSVESEPMGPAPHDVFFNSTPVHRVTRLDPVHLGEQIVGSDHAFPVAGPINVSLTSGSVAAAIAGDAAFGVEWGNRSHAVDLEPGATPPPIRIRYAPKTVGAHTARLQLTAHYPDDHVEKQVVPIDARARDVDQAPSSPSTPESRSDANDDATPDDRAELASQADVDDSVAYAEYARNCFGKQLIGVNSVEAEQGKFKLPEAPKELWLVFAELAVSLGTGGLATIAGKLLKQTLASSLGIGAKAVDGATAVAGANVAGAIANPRINLRPLGPTRNTVANLPARVEADVASRASGVVDGLLGGFKSAADSAVIGALAPTPGAKAAKASSSMSKDPTIDFFAGQRSLIIDAQMKAVIATNGVRAQVRGLEKRFPGTRAAFSGALAVATDESGRIAHEAQANHTAGQLSAYKARAALGTERVASPHATFSDFTESTVTKLDEVRSLRFPEGAAGLLDVHVRITGGRQAVIKASARDLNTHVATRVLDLDLRAARVPIRVVVNDFGFITRDELGRVRYSGLTHLEPGHSASVPVNERQELRTAQRIVDTLLSQTLRSWGLDTVHTNDTTPPGKEGEK